MHKVIYTILTIFFTDFIDSSMIDTRFLLFGDQPLRDILEWDSRRESKWLFRSIEWIGFRVLAYQELFVNLKRKVKCRNKHVSKRKICGFADGFGNIFLIGAVEPTCFGSLYLSKYKLNGFLRANMISGGW